MNIDIELTAEQSRKVCFDHIANHMVIMKQYISIDEFKHFKFVLEKMGTLIEIDQFQKEFDRAWPNDLVWGDLHDE